MGQVESETGQIRMAISGAATPFGCEALRSLNQWNQAIFVVAVDPHEFGKSTRAIAGSRAPDILVEEKLSVALEREVCDVLIDFGHPPAALAHGISALNRGVCPILNASYSGPELRELRTACKEAQLPALVLPHLALAEVFFLRSARWAARWTSDVEVLDIHPDHRRQTPSPLARAAAEAIAEGWVERELASSLGIDSKATRTWEDVSLSILRLKGAHARQEIRCGASGESLSVAFEPKDESAIVEGLKLAVSQVRSLSGVTVGLEKLIFASNMP